MRNIKQYHKFEFYFASNNENKKRQQFLENENKKPYP